MAEFDLDLESIERNIDDVDDRRIVLDVLDGSTPPEERIETIADGNVLVLSVEGDVRERAAGFAEEIKEAGGQLVHFRQFLIVAPPGFEVDTDRLN